MWRTTSHEARSLEESLDALNPAPVRTFPVAGAGSDGRKCRFRIFRQTDSGNSGRLGAVGQALVELKVARPMRRSVEVEESATLEDSVEDGGSQILIV